MMDHFGLVQADDGFSQGIVVRVTGRPDGGIDTNFSLALCLADRQILTPPVAVMDQNFTLLSGP